MVASHRARLVVWLAAAAAVAGCERESVARAVHEARAPALGPIPEAGSRAAPESAARVSQPRARAQDPRVERAIRALERGDAGAATRELAAFGAGLELDHLLLSARARALEGDAVRAVRALEAARADSPAEGAVYATAAEIHAAAGRLESAEDEIRRGLAASGPTAELLRARGILALCRKGGARVGLERLLEARALDPELPFCGRPLSQAHLLLGNAALAAQDTAGALGHARAALAADPENSEARELAGDAHAARGEFTAALAEYEALFASGRDVQAALALLSQRGATAALLERDRPMALRRYLRARELGLSDEELGFGATVLAEEAHRRVGEGLAAREAGDPERAGEAFARALELDPHSLETESLLALVLFERGEFDGAAQHWRSVLDAARERALELEEPVHLHLARALHRLGRDGEVRAVLEDYLAREPEGEWAGATREMLGKL